MPKAIEVKLADSRPGATTSFGARGLAEAKFVGMGSLSRPRSKESNSGSANDSNLNAMHLNLGSSASLVELPSSLHGAGTSGASSFKPQSRIGDVMTKKADAQYAYYTGSTAAKYRS